MTWFWMNIPPAVLCFLAWTLIPLWMVFKHPDTGPGIPPHPATQRRPGPVPPSLPGSPRQPSPPVRRTTLAKKPSLAHH